eukprot:3319065-Prymnesium_polylepis.1
MRLETHTQTQLAQPQASDPHRCRRVARSPRTALAPPLRLRAPLRASMRLRAPPCPPALQTTLLARLLRAPPMCQPDRAVLQLRWRGAHIRRRHAPLRHRSSAPLLLCRCHRRRLAPAPASNARGASSSARAPGQAQDRAS